MTRFVVRVNSIITALLAAWLLVYPAMRAGLAINDPGLKGPGIPEADWRMMLHLTPRYAAWAKQRVSAGRAEKLSTSDISGTEWPLFGSVFYLWAVENLQNAWETGDLRAGVEPKVFCKEAIIAASQLVIDPKHASWVEKHWGTNYLHRENVFYRMLVISALTSRERLLHGDANLDLLRDEVETFSKELDESKSGLLNDYPGECYPGDVMCAVASIRRADSVLGTDHSEFARRAVRGFTGPNSTRLNLPPYSAGAETGAPYSEARGCGNSYFCLTSPELWPDSAKTWLQLYEKYFWQERLGFTGFREYPKDLPNRDWTMDVDAGPVIDGFGVAANSFGVGAARRNGRFDLAYPLSMEMLTSTWELPDGTLAVPRLLSNLSDAPLLGDAAILWLLSVQPAPGFEVKKGGAVPGYVWILIIVPSLLGTLAIATAIRTFRRSLAADKSIEPAPRIQIIMWASLIVGAVGASRAGAGLLTLAFLLGALLFPRLKRTSPRQEAPPTPA